MAKYRKKPVVVEAIEWKGSNLEEVITFTNGNAQPHASELLGLWIKTLEGGHIASKGDFIIKGVVGEFYPCKPDIFEKTYEVINEN